jgi:TonB family protein
MIHMRVRKQWPLFLVLIASATSLAAVVPSVPQSFPRSDFATRERQVWGSALHDPDIASTLRTWTRANCEASRPPEPLATPDPLLDAIELNTRARVSFIIGTDGRVYSPLILESAGQNQDRTILDTVRAWRYRPAMCNGAATETESKVEFSSR